LPPRPEQSLPKSLAKLWLCRPAAIVTLRTAMLHPPVPSAVVNSSAWNGHFGEIASLLSVSPPVRRREIGAHDIDRTVDLLTSGFGMHRRKRTFWERALARMAAHRTPSGYPKYGYLLECNGTPVGVALMIYSTIVVDGRPRIRCSMSSWYVQPAFRLYGGQLTSCVFRQKEVTFVNITPDPRSFPALEAMGYRRYCTGRFVAAPMLSASPAGAGVRMATTELSVGADLSAFEIQLLLDHRDYGCISVTCEAAGQRHPFVFQRRCRGLLSFAYLAYCRDVADFVRLAGPLGRFLALRGMPLVVADADGPIAGLIGRYSDGHPKYYRGPDPPRLGDLAYSERVLFGF
jgi:hypothetical protein